MIRFLLEGKACVELQCERAQVVSAHVVVVELSRFFFAQQFRSVDGAAGSFLVQEVDYRRSHGEVLVHFPVHSTEGFPASVEVQCVGQVGIGLSEISEAEPQAQVGGDVVAGIQLHQYLRDFLDDIAVGVQVGHSLERRLDEIVVVRGLLISEQGVQVEAFDLGSKLPGSKFW